MKKSKPNGNTGSTTGLATCAVVDSSLQPSCKSQLTKQTTGNLPPSNSESACNPTMRPESDLVMFTCQMPTQLRSDITKARKREKVKNDSVWVRGVLKRATAV